MEDEREYQVICIKPDGEMILESLKYERDVLGAMRPVNQNFDCPTCGRKNNECNLRILCSIEDYSYFLYFSDPHSPADECDFPNHIYQEFLLSIFRVCGPNETCTDHRGNIYIEKVDPSLRNVRSRIVDSDLNDLEFIRETIEAWWERFQLKKTSQGAWNTGIWEWAKWKFGF